MALSSRGVARYDPRTRPARATIARSRARRRPCRYAPSPRIRWKRDARSTWILLDERNAPGTPVCHARGHPESSSRRLGYAIDTQTSQKKGRIEIRPLRLPLPSSARAGEDKRRALKRVECRIHNRSRSLRDAFEQADQE